MEAVGDLHRSVNNEIIGFSVALVLLFLFGIVILLMVCKKGGQVGSDEQ